MLRLEFPNETHREMYEDMLQEWWNIEQIPTSPSVLFHWKNYIEFLRYVRSLKQWMIEWRTPSTLFLGVDRGKIIGAIDVRHNIDHPDLRDYSGHIGYGIRPSERQKWYATQILQLGLGEARKIWILKILISCRPDNIASEKVIIKNGWLYDFTAEKKGKLYKRHWITI